MRDETTTDLTTDIMTLPQFVDYACGQVQLNIGREPLTSIMFGIMLAAANNTKFGGMKNNKTPEAPPKPRRGKRTTRRVARSRKPKEAK